MTLVYVAIVLAAPLLLYSGPDVMSPVASMIADEALDGTLPLHFH